MSAATQGTKTMLEAIECEKERDRYWWALTDIAGYEGWQTPGVPAAKVMGDIAREALVPDQDREANSKPDPTIAKDLD